MLFGEEGQERLKKSNLFIAGAGGLGSPISIYLAVAGVGTITLVDMDVVELTNLNRQILHFDKDIGKTKTSSAEEKLTALNPDITVKVIETTIDESNASGNWLEMRMVSLMGWITFPPVMCSTKPRSKRISRFSMVQFAGYTGRQQRLYPERLPVCDVSSQKPPQKKYSPWSG